MPTPENVERPHRPHCYKFEHGHATPGPPIGAGQPQPHVRSQLQHSSLQSCGATLGKISSTKPHTQCISTPKCQANHLISPWSSWVPLKSVMAESDPPWKLSFMAPNLCKKMSPSFSQNQRRHRRGTCKGNGKGVCSTKEAESPDKIKPSSPTSKNMIS
jgi:hypothetical protein